ncbi:MAG TPA: hypothetical protein VJT73_13810 [Polyangiaceae bacterium]|nr:hypothetical protein [Polyangiaceae bacterium]
MALRSASGIISLALCIWGVAGCAALGNFSPTVRVQDAANDLTTATRFGRMDVAMERVSRAGREPFARRHANWGGSLRVVDCEILGLRLTDKEHAVVMLSVNWQRLDDTEMRSTQITQHWQDHRGTWLLETEERTTGDVGLLGDNATVVRPPPSSARFETITIR